MGVILTDDLCQHLDGGHHDGDCPLMVCFGFVPSDPRAGLRRGVPSRALTKVDTLTYSGVGEDEEVPGKGWRVQLASGLS